MIKVFTIGVNPVETYIREGHYSALPALPFTPGSDCAGVIEHYIYSEHLCILLYILYILQVLIKVFTVGVNPVETYIREGHYSALPALPFTPGSDCAGVIDEVGENVTKFKV